jgi:hypothetical protein
MIKSSKNIVQDVDYSFSTSADHVVELTDVGKQNRQLACIVRSE